MCETRKKKLDINLFHHCKLRQVQERNTLSIIAIKVPVFPVIAFAVTWITHATHGCLESSTHLAPVAKIIQHIVHGASNRIRLAKIAKMLANHIVLTHINLLDAAIMDREYIEGKQPDAQVLILILDKHARPLHTCNQMDNVSR